MATLSEQLETLRASRYSGIRTVSYGDRTVTYKSDQEMRAAEADLLERIASESGTRHSRSYVEFSRD